jgi:hypothetical protein
LKASVGAIERDERMRLQIISLDLMVALPIASAAILLLFSGFYSSQSYLTNSAGGSEKLLLLYYDSQLIINLIGTTNPNYTGAMNILENASIVYGINATLSELNQTPVCIGMKVCRIVTVSSKSYILTVMR